MRGRLTNVLQSSRIQSRMEYKRKLVLHFDINKTIVPVDTATGETVEASLNVYMSGLAWGRETAGVWEKTDEILSSSPGPQANVSFYKFEERRLLREKSMDRAAFRIHLTSFTDRPQGIAFKPYFNTLLSKLHWKLPYNEELHESITVPGTREDRYHFILPAFYRLLTELTENGRDFSVILRSYGSDCDSVINSIKSSIKNGMPYCQKLHGLQDKVHDTVYKITRESDKTFALAPCQGENFHDILCCTDEEMYDKLSKYQGIVAVKDDMKIWYLNNFDPDKGKPIWIDETDPDTHHIFFDDNIRPGHEDSIVNIRLKTSEHGFENVQRSEEVTLVNRNIVPVIFSDAILNEDYFVNKVGECETNYEKHTSTQCVN